jgi:hypothetical protein
MAAQRNHRISQQLGARGSPGVGFLYQLKETRATDTPQPSSRRECTGLVDINL